MIFYAHIRTLFGVPLVSSGPAYWGYLWPIIFAQKAVRRLIFPHSFFQIWLVKFLPLLTPLLPWHLDLNYDLVPASFLLLFSNLSFISKFPITLWWCSFYWLWCVRHPVSCGRSPNGIILSTSISILDRVFLPSQPLSLEGLSFTPGASFLSWLLTANALSSPCSQ